MGCLGGSLLARNLSGVTVSTKLHEATQNKSMQYYETEKNSDIYHPHWLLYDRESGDNLALVAFGVIVLHVGIFAFCGNFGVISLMYRFRSLRTSANLFVLNLAVADMLLVLTNFPLLVIASFAGNWYFGQIGCKIYGFSGALTGFVSINTLTAIALERFVVIAWKKPLHYNRTPSRTVVSISVLIWLYSSLWALAPVIGWGSYILEGSFTSCTFDFFTRSDSNRAYVMSIFILCFGVQLCVITLSYLIIFVKVLRHERGALYHNGGDQVVCIRVNNKVKSAKVQIRIAKIVLVIIAVFSISWMPYAVVALIGIYGDASVITPLTSTIPGVFAKLSTAINPIIYALIHPKFRNKLRYSLRKSARFFTNATYNSLGRTRNTRVSQQQTGTLHSTTRISDDLQLTAHCVKETSV